MSKFFEKLKQSLVMQGIFFLTSISCLFAVYFICINGMNYKRTVSDKAEAIPQVTCNIDDFEWGEKEIHVSGWVLAHDSFVKDIKLVLKDKSAKSFVYKTEQGENEFVENYFGLEGEYGEISFDAVVEKEDLEENKCYEMILTVQYKNKNDGRTYRKNIKTEQYIYAGNKYDYNPLEFVEPYFEDDFMNNVVQDGELIFYSNEYTTYIYKYDGYTYWIVGDKFEFSPLGRTVVIYFAGTSQLELLDKGSQERGYIMFDFYFENYEVTPEGESEYRVSAKKIEMDMPITYLKTGLYNEENENIVWERYFYPTYEISGD